MTRSVRCIAVIALSVALGCTAADSSTQTGPADASASSTRPNILVMVVDDMRWDDFGAAGHPFVKTPNIDRLAREGARFLNAFTTTPLCSPARASLLTGQYAHTNGIIDNVERGPRSHEMNTFPRQLNQAGYETAFVGSRGAPHREVHSRWLTQPDDLDELSALAKRTCPWGKDSAMAELVFAEDGLTIDPILALDWTLAFEQEAAA